MKSEPLLLPILLLAVALFVEVITRTIGLLGNHSELQAIYDSQEAQYKTAVDLRAQFQGIASDTARLSEGGNPNALAVMQRLQAAGISVQLPAAPPAPAQAPRP